LRFIFKRNVIHIMFFMSIELNAERRDLAFVTLQPGRGKLDGQVFVLFVIVVAAAEAAVGLGIIIFDCAQPQTLNVERVTCSNSKCRHIRCSNTCGIVPLLPLLARR